jgi:hypothetical protein
MDTYFVTQVRKNSIVNKTNRIQKTFDSNVPT